MPVLISRPELKNVPTYSVSPLVTGEDGVRVTGFLVYCKKLIIQWTSSNPRCKTWPHVTRRSTVGKCQGVFKNLISEK
jgi:hypothetical protein